LFTCRDLARTVPLRAAVVFQTNLHQPQFRAQLPAGVHPKLHACRIIREDEDVAFGNAGLAEFRQTGIYQSPADASLTMPLGHREMMQVTAPAVVAAQHGANYPAILLRNETEAWIVPQKRGDGPARVGFIQSHPFRAPPQGDDRVVIFKPKSADDDPIVAGAAGKFLFQSAFTFWTSFHGLG